MAAKRGSKRKLPKAFLENMKKMKEGKGPFKRKASKRSATKK
jgi:hypothetical protein